jgi:hypothetical protein
VSHDDSSRLVFSQDDYIKYFPRYYANPQVSLLGSDTRSGMQSLQGAEPEEGELSIWRKISLPPPPVPCAKRSGSMGLMLAIALLVLVMMMKK